YAIVGVAFDSSLQRGGRARQVAPQAAKARQVVMDGWVIRSHFQRGIGVRRRLIKAIQAQISKRPVRESQRESCVQSQGAVIVSDGLVVAMQLVISSPSVVEGNRFSRILSQSAVVVVYRIL